MKKQHVLFVALVLALVLCFSFGAMAAPIVHEVDGDANKYTIDENIAAGFSEGDIVIKTVGAYKAEKLGAKTYFENGEAINDNDIIISNGKVGVVLAVGTRNPWGYPAGSILDAGYIVDGTPARDTVWSIEYLAHRWDSWAPDNCGNVHFDLVKYDFDNCIEGFGIDAVKVTRAYSLKKDLTVVTYYAIEEGAQFVYAYTATTNNGTEATGEMKNSFAITNKGDDGGFMKYLDGIRCVGSYGNTAGQEYSTFVAGPEMGDGFYKKGSLGYLELVENINYDPGETYVNKHFVVIDDNASTEALSEFLMDWNEVEDADKINIAGTVVDSNGTAVADPVVVVKQGSAVYGWFIGDDEGSFDFDLPAGEYNLFVERDGYAPGESTTVASSTSSLVLESGDKKVDVTFNVEDKDGNPLFAKVELFDANGVSVYPTVRFCGEAVYNAQEKGVVETQIAPGEYKAVVYGEGFWFYCDAVEVNGDTADGDQTISVDMVYGAPEGWLCADMHHHANKNDAFADPTDAIPALCASGLDVAFITDHDFTVNNAKGYELAEDYGMTGFVPSEEISCSWAHFNVIPLDEDSYNYFKDEDQENHVMNQFGKLPDFVNQTHEKGAAITANHPWYSYGLLYAYSIDAIPGGYTDDYDNFEINSSSTNQENLDTIVSGMDLWTSYANGEAIYKDIDGNDVVTEKAHYILGGSDTHDVLYPGFADKNYKNTLRSSTDYVSGKVRTYAYVDKTGDSIVDNGLAFAKAVVDGHSYVTYGPLLDMDQKPGNLYNLKASDNTLKVKFEIEDLDNIADVLVLSEYGEDEYTDFADSFGTSANQGLPLTYDKASSVFDINAKTYTFNAEFTAKPGDSTWFALVVVDENGNYAITNPYWVTCEGFPDVPATAWYADAVADCVFAGIINGCDDGNFQADRPVTRGEFCAMLCRFANISDEDLDAAKTTFPDNTNWAKKYISLLADRKVITGYPNGNVGPEDPIDRAQAATILCRACGLDPVTGNSMFSDVSAKAWYAPYTNAVGKAGLMKGNEKGLFMPDRITSRAEAAQMFSNLMKYAESME